MNVGGPPDASSLLLWFDANDVDGDGQKDSLGDNSAVPIWVDKAPLRGSVGDKLWDKRFGGSGVLSERCYKVIATLPIVNTNVLQESRMLPNV